MCIKKCPALKARFIPVLFQAIVALCRNRSAKSSFISFLVPRIAKPGWMPVRPRMHAYLATICRDLGGEALLVGGVGDHVHIVTTLPRTLSQADLIEGIKKTSSKWIK